MQYRIMIVDDDANVLNSLRRTLVVAPDSGDDRHSWNVELFTSAQDALRRADYIPFDLVLSDYRMPDINGVEFLIKVREIQPKTMRMIMSGHADLDCVIGAINEAQIFRFITKPWQDAELRAAVAQALAVRHLVMENQQLADIVRVQKGKLSQQELALRRLEEHAPGITKVNWGTDGSVLLDLDEDE